MIRVLTADELKNVVGDPSSAGFGAIETAQGCLPLTALDVDVQIEGLAAKTTVRQQFCNRFNDPLEATYIFPLPPRAAVTAASSPSSSFAATFAIPASIFASGRNSPMIPVESTSTSSAAAFTAAPAAAAMARASSSPRAPVQAFALPELTTIARKFRPGVSDRS